MIIPDDKKKAVTTIMRKRSPKGELLSEAPMKPQEALNPDGSTDGRLTAAQDMIAAHHAGDAMKLMGALSNFIDVHKGPSTEE